MESLTLCFMDNSNSITNTRRDKIAYYTWQCLKTQYNWGLFHTSSVFMSGDQFWYLYFIYTPDMAVSWLYWAWIIKVQAHVIKPPNHQLSIPSHWKNRTAVNGVPIHDSSHTSLIIAIITAHRNWDGVKEVRSGMQIVKSAFLKAYQHCY